MRFSLFLSIFIMLFSLNVYSNDTEVIEITIKDHKFHPSEIKVASGSKIKLIIKNLDDAIEEFESEDLHREKIVAPHKTIKINLGSLKPGKYEFFGEFHPETAQGVIIAE